MRQRCSNPTNPKYKDYGGRGIKVCERWQTFDNFYEDIKALEPRPSPAHSINRIDNDGNYEPGNVEWADRSKQQSNTRANRRITYNGETRTLTEWAQYLGMSICTLHTRLSSGWSIGDALSAPIKQQQSAALPFKEKILSLREQGMSVPVIAVKLGLQDHVIYRFLRGIGQHTESFVLNDYMQRNPERRARGEKSGTAKLTPEKVLLIHEMRAQGYSYVEIGQTVGCTPENTSLIARGRRWRHILGQS